MNRKYKVVFLDWNGTLSNSKFWGHLEKTNKEMFTLIEKSLFTNFRHQIEPWMKGKIKAEEITKQIAKNTRLSHKIIFNELRHSCNQMHFVDMEITNLIEKIQSNGTKVVIATDNMDTFTRWTVKTMRLDKIFDRILNSHKLKTLKKDRDSNNKSLFFNNFLDEEKIKPEECILIDDSLSDIEIIKTFGIDYLHLKKIEDLVPTLSNYIN